MDPRTPFSDRPPPPGSIDEYMADDGLGAIRGLVNGFILLAAFVFAAGLVVSLAMAAWWFSRGVISPRLGDLVGTAVYYLDTGPGCPGADPAWLGRCADAPEGR